MNFENRVEAGWRDADAGVAHGETMSPSFRLTAVKFRPLGEFDGIVQQVVQYLAQAHGVGVKLFRQVGGQVQGKAQLFPAAT